MNILARNGEYVLGRYQRIYEKLSTQRANFDYSELKSFLIWCGFRCREKPTHSIFTYPGLKEHLNIVRDGNRVKRPCYVDNAKKIVDQLNFMGMIDFLEGDE